MLRHYAQIGAQVRITELENEIAGIRRAFPDLGDGAVAVPAVRDMRTRHKMAVLAPTREPQARAAQAEQSKRKRRKMSATARKAIGDAQRRRWAAQKKIV